MNELVANRTLASAQLQNTLFRGIIHVIIGYNITMKSRQNRIFSRRTIWVSVIQAKGEPIEHPAGSRVGSRKTY